MTSPTPLNSILSVPVQYKKELQYESTPEEDIPTGLLIIDQKAGTDTVDLKFFIGHSNAKSSLKLLVKKGTQLTGCPGWFIIILLGKYSNWLLWGWSMKSTGRRRGLQESDWPYSSCSHRRWGQIVFTFGKSRQRKKWGINISRTMDKPLC